MACKRCQKKVSDDDIVVCRGYCGASYHAVCVNVDAPLRQQLEQYRNNVFWMCDGCAIMFSNAHFRALMTGFDEKISVMPAAIQSMQDEIEKLHTSMKALTAKVDGIPATPYASPFASPNPWPAIHRLNRTAKTGNLSPAKRLRDCDGKSVSIVGEPIKTGTRAPSAIPSVRLGSRSEEEAIWLYLTAFHPSTTENQVASFVTECLELPANAYLKAIKLVPKGRDINSLNYVSFKIGLSGQFKEKALSCDSWPEHIRFREFEDNRAKNLPRVISLSATGQRQRNDNTTTAMNSSSMEILDLSEHQDARDEA